MLWILCYVAGDEALSLTAIKAKVPDAPLLDVKDLHVGVAGSDDEIEVVRGLSLSVGVGEFLGIVGESGSGKTMTALSIMGLLPAGAQIRAGSIRFEGEELVHAPRRVLDRVRGRRMAMVFQEPMTSLNPLMRVGRQVAEPLLLHRLAHRRPALQQAEKQLREVGIPDAARRSLSYPHEYSGGMRQRAMIAAALIGEPKLLIADEPTTALDVTVQAQILRLLRDPDRNHGNAVIFVSHDLAVVSRLCDRIAVMYAGRVVETGETKVLLSSPKHPYTRALLNALPTDDTRPRDRLRAIGGEPPNLGNLPKGCPFAPRCPFKAERCITEEPTLIEFGQSEAACWFGDSLPAWSTKSHPES
jgi:oligopeptide/dipeptide ABC transporter ATP-binding protein